MGRVFVVGVGMTKVNRLFILIKVINVKIKNIVFSSSTNQGKEMMSIIPTTPRKLLLKPWMMPKYLSKMLNKRVLDTFMVRFFMYSHGV